MLIAALGLVILYSLNSKRMSFLRFACDLSIKANKREKEEKKGEKKLKSF